MFSNGNSGTILGLRRLVASNSVEPLAQSTFRFGVRDGPALGGLFNALFNLVEQQQPFHRIFDTRIVRQVTNDIRHLCFQ